MKPINSILTVALAVFAIVIAYSSYRTTSLTHKTRSMAPDAQRCAQVLGKTQALLNDLGAYNQKAQNPDITQILKSFQVKPAAPTH